MRKRIRDVISCLERHALLKDCVLSPLSLDTELADITFDSRTAGKDSLFVCKGAAFKRDYLMSAFENGAILYLAEHEIEDAFPHILVHDIRLAMSRLAALFFEQEAERVYKIGITGTKGKTTVACMVKSILDSYCMTQYSSRSALISSLYIDDGGERLPSSLSTPEAIELHRHLAAAGQNGLPYAVIEVSSQALKYRRVADITFDTALFLNIGNDHISPIEHPDFEDYLNAKLQIFERASSAVINSSAEHAERILSVAKTFGCRLYTFGFSRSDTLYCLADDTEEGQTVFTVSYDGGIPERYAMKFHGRHNIENALAAILTAKLLKIPNDYIAQGLLSANAEGRGDEYASEDGSLRLIVDYAHNGMSLEALYRYVEAEYPDHAVITLFGCPGGKAQNRRGDMGLMAGLHSNLVILTEDDPDRESTLAICDEIARYLGDTPYLIEPERSSAIRTAFENRFSKTVILLCGKGAERTQKKNGCAAPYEGDAYHAENILAEYEALLPIG